MCKSYLLSILIHHLLIAHLGSPPRLRGTGHSALNAESAATVDQRDSVIDELNAMAQSKGGSFALALYMLGFSSYYGFH